MVSAWTWSIRCFYWHSEVNSSQRSSAVGQLYLTDWILCAYFKVSALTLDKSICQMSECKCVDVVSDFLLTWWWRWASMSQAPDFWEGKFPSQFNVVSSRGLQLFPWPAQGTVLLLFHLSISSEYSPRARQTSRVCYQDSLSWFLASPARIPIHTTEERHHCSLCVSCSLSAEVHHTQLILSLPIIKLCRFAMTIVK